MLRLHHSRASTASTIIRLVLAEKRLAYDSHLLDLHRGDQHTPQYRAINPRGLVPALEHDGRVILESKVIAVYIDDTFSEPPLVPSGTRADVQAWLDQIADRVHPATVTLTYALAFRRMLAQRPRAELEAYFARITEDSLRERERAAVLHGLDAPQVPDAFATHVQLIEAMDESLARGLGAPAARRALARRRTCPAELRHSDHARARGRRSRAVDRAARGLGASVHSGLMRVSGTSTSGSPLKAADAASRVVSARRSADRLRRARCL